MSFDPADSIQRKNPVVPDHQREFRCSHCGLKIQVPLELPPTTGPCPHCGGIITSPDLAEGVIEVAAYRIPPPPIDPTDAEISTPLAAPEVPQPATRSPAEVPQPAAAKPGKPQRSILIPLLLLVLALSLAGGGGVYYAAQKMGSNIAPPTFKTSKPVAPPTEAEYLRSGWQKEAHQLLRGYLAATNTAGKIPFILNGEALASKIESFYQPGLTAESNIAAEAFSAYPLTAEDQKRGLFLMVYSQPTVGSPAHDGPRVQAFFKRTPQGLKLDWEIFVQTQHRTLWNLQKRPELGRGGVFRVLIAEEAPDPRRAVAGFRDYRVKDPANSGDTARVTVKADSEAGRALSLIHGPAPKNERPITRTATLELTWRGTPASPQLEISRFICWEFLGLGGQEPSATAPAP